MRSIHGVTHVRRAPNPGRSCLGVRFKNQIFNTNGRFIFFSWLTLINIRPCACSNRCPVDKN
jgi:hypothetical protein